MDSIIFDVDGTLWDSVQAVTDAWNLALKKEPAVDMTIDSSVLGKLFGKTMDEIGDALFDFLPKEERMRVLEACMDYEIEYLKEHPGIPYDGVLDTIPSLAERYPLFIVSNCQCGYIEALLEALHLEPYITDHLCFGETKTSKGQTLRTLIQRNHLQSPIYLGDTKGDQEACKEAGIPFLFASYGLGEVPDAERSISSFSELAGLF